MQSDMTLSRGIRIPFRVTLSTRLSVVFVLLSVLFAPQVWAQSKTADYAVALSGEYAVVGAEWHDGFRGAAYVLKRSGGSWGEPQKLSPADLGRFDHFGSSVSISGDYAVVGTTWQNLSRGAVYVFKRAGSDWVEEQKLTPRDAMPDSRFGGSVRIEGDDITVGGALGAGRDTRPNTVYRFRRAGEIWIEEETIEPALKESIVDIVETGQAAPEGSTAGVGEAALESATGKSLTSDWVAESSPASDDVLALIEALPLDSDDPFLLPATAPPEPDTVIATDGTFEDRVQVMWSNAGLDAIVYRILRNGVLLSVASSMDSVYMDNTAVPGDVYNYCVVVKNMWGEESAAKCDSGSCIIFPPRDVWASDGEYDQFVRITWTDVSAVEVGYRVKRDDILIGQTGANESLFEDTTAVPGSENTYLYEIIAFDALGRESESSSDNGFRGQVRPFGGRSASGAHSFRNRACVRPRHRALGAAVHQEAPRGHRGPGLFHRPPDPR
ncbi:MAG: FG-GAP repeat protein [Candidatus Eiseniibacteriota bacterium]|nr:MAG: FG-GAP repeat protein [Candidatus Eisenbacteria bacterium]